MNPTKILRLNRDFCIRTLIVEKDSEDGKKAISYMDKSGLPYELIEIDKIETDKSGLINVKIPRMLAGWFYSIDGLDMIHGILDVSV